MSGKRSHRFPVYRKSSFTCKRPEFGVWRGTAMSTATVEENLNRAFELIGGSIDPEIAESYPSLEARILAQALENVEVAERRLREIQKLVGEISDVLV
jgi:hypothetical protein